MPQGNLSMLGEGGGGSAPIFPGNASVGGAAAAPGAPPMQQQGGGSGLETMQMMKLMQDMKARQQGQGSTGSAMGGKSGANPGAAQQSADAIGMAGGGM